MRLIKSDQHTRHLRLAKVARKEVRQWLREGREGGRAGSSGAGLAEVRGGGAAWPASEQLAQGWVADTIPSCPRKTEEASKGCGRASRNHEREEPGAPGSWVPGKNELRPAAGL